MSEAIDVLWDSSEPEDTALIDAVSGWGNALLAAADASNRGLSIVLTDDRVIRTLNLQWRQLDEPTDVLSFPMDEGETFTAPNSPDHVSPLGDVVISLETAARQAPKHDYTLMDEVRFLLVHGVCHLLGHDHGEPEEAARMREAERRLLAAIAPEQRRPETPY